MELLPPIPQTNPEDMKKVLKTHMLEKVLKTFLGVLKLCEGGVEKGSKIPTFITDFFVGPPFLVFIESQREHGYYVSVVRAFIDGKYCFFSLEFPVIVALLR